MPKVKYTGLADRKELSAKDWEAVGVDDQNKVVFTNDAPEQEVSDAAWAWLSSEASGEASVFSLSDASEGGDEAPSPDAPNAGADPVAPGGTPESETGTDRAKATTSRGSTRGT